MIRQMVILTAFLLALAGIVSGVVVIQKTAKLQITKVERIIKTANEID